MCQVYIDKRPCPTRPESKCIRCGREICDEHTYAAGPGTYRLCVVCSPAKKESES